MTKTRAVLILVLLLVVGVIFLFIKTGLEKVSTPSATEVTPTIEPIIGEKDYKDPSGFAILYPDNLQVTPEELSDENDYALVTINSPEKPGKITIYISGTDFNTTDEYLKDNKIKDTTAISLADLDAEQYEEKSVTTTALVDQNVLYLITLEATESVESWQKTYKKVIESFTFYSPEETAESTADQAPATKEYYEGDIVEEEVIE